MTLSPDSTKYHVRIMVDIFVNSQHPEHATGFAEGLFSPYFIAAAKTAASVEAAMAYDVERVVKLNNEYEEETE